MNVKSNKIKGYKHKITSVFVSLVTLGLPLIVTNGYYNITETKMIYYYVASLFLFVSAIISRLSERESLHSLAKISFCKIDRAMLLYFLSVLIASLLSDYDDVWLGQHSRYQGVVMISLYVIVYFIVSRNLENSNKFLICTVMSLVIVSLIGVFNCFDIDVVGFYSELADNYKGAYISTIGNINFYSSYLCLVLPVVICGFCLTKTVISTTIYLISIVIGTLGAMVTSSESFVIGFVISMIIIPMFIFNNASQLKRFVVAIMTVVAVSQIFLLIYNVAQIKNIKISKLMILFTNPIFSLIVIGICLSVLIVLHEFPDKLKVIKTVYYIGIGMSAVILICLFVVANISSVGWLDSYFKITDNWGTYRGEIWKQCVEIFKNFSTKEKIFGIGPESLYKVTEALDVHNNQRLDQAHNEYLQHLLTIGCVGLISYLSVIFSVTFTVTKWLNKNTLAVGLLAGLIGFWVQAIVNIAQPFTTPLMYVFISVIGALYYREKQKIEIS